jgi:hypothetical protein
VAKPDGPKVEVPDPKVPDRTVDRMGAVVVRTIEMGPYPDLPPHECEYWLRIVDGTWRLDDRRERDYEGRWMHFVF